jgi:short-subunit dehydrogenase
VLGFSRSLYEEVREFGIHVNVFYPGATNAEFMQVAGFRRIFWSCTVTAESRFV